MKTAGELSNFSPTELMSQLDRRDSLFFDSSGNFPKSYNSPISIIASEPQKIIRGNISDPSELKAVMETHQGLSTDLGYPEGGLAGWIGYDGNFTFGVYDDFLVYDHVDEQWLTELKINPPQLPQKEFSLGEWKSLMNQKQYQEAVQTAKEYIAAGDIYQVNLSQKFSAPISSDSDLFSLYQRLRYHSPAPMACYGQLDGRELLCSSPETFMRMSGSVVETRPIKGTSPRYSDPEKDNLSAYELVTSPKENAELVMITDLLRNDLGRVCDFGSVKVEELLTLERLQHVFHLVSTIKGNIQPDFDHLDVLQACLPGGSITGAPKIRAMEVINELEPASRGLYTGVVGYLGFNGESQFNIIIRSLMREQSSLSYHVGAGIVADSCPEKEYLETQLKAEGIRRSLESFLV